MSKKYLKQWDLPCYPNDKPLPGSRTIIGIKRGSIFDPKFTGYGIWMGGGRISQYHANGANPATLPRAIAHTHEEVRKHLEDRVTEARNALDHAQRLLTEWTEFPEGFAVKPEDE